MRVRVRVRVVEGVRVGGERGIFEMGGGGWGCGGGVSGFFLFSLWWLIQHQTA